MPFRSRNFLRPIKSNKHEITWSNLSQNASAVKNIPLVVPVASADKDTETECEIGSHVKSIYFEFHFGAETITSAKVIHWKFFVQSGGETISVPSLYYQTDRSRISKRGMEMLPKDVATIFKRIFVVKIPRHQQRITATSFMTLSYICSSTETINACGIAIYKEYY